MPKYKIQFQQGLSWHKFLNSYGAETQCKKGAVLNALTTRTWSGRLKVDTKSVRIIVNTQEVLQWLRKLKKNTQESSRKRLPTVWA